MFIVGCVLSLKITPLYEKHIFILKHLIAKTLIADISRTRKKIKGMMNDIQR